MGEGTIFRFMGEHSCYEGDIELMEVPPLGKTLEQWDDMFLVHFFPRRILTTVFLASFQKQCNNHRLQLWYNQEILADSI